MIKPLRDKILVRPIERIKSHIVDVVMTENANTGEVIAVGPGEYDKKGRLIPNPCEVGQTVRFGTAKEYLKFQEVEHQGQVFLIMSHKDVCWIEEAHG